MPKKKTKFPQFVAWGKQGSRAWKSPIHVPVEAIESRRKRITIGEVCMTLQEWLKQYGVPRGAYYNRLKKGWSVEAAITTPILK